MDRWRAPEKIHQFGINELLNLSARMTTLKDAPPVPPIDQEITVEGILHALSDPVRVAIYADIVAQECSQNCSTS